MDLPVEIIEHILSYLPFNKETEKIYEACNLSHIFLANSRIGLPESAWMFEINITLMDGGDGWWLNGKQHYRATLNVKDKYKQRFKWKYPDIPPNKEPFILFSKDIMPPKPFIIRGHYIILDSPYYIWYRQYNINWLYLLLLANVFRNTNHVDDVIVLNSDIRPPEMALAGFEFGHVELCIGMYAETTVNKIRNSPVPNISVINMPDEIKK